MFKVCMSGISMIFAWPKAITHHYQRCSYINLSLAGFVKVLCGFMVLLLVFKRLKGAAKHVIPISPQRAYIYEGAKGANASPQRQALPLTRPAWDIETFLKTKKEEQNTRLWKWLMSCTISWTICCHSPNKYDRELLKNGSLGHEGGIRMSTIPNFRKLLQLLTTFTRHPSSL